MLEEFLSTMRSLLSRRNRVIAILENFGVSAVIIKEVHG